MAEFTEVPGGNELKSGQMKMFNIGKREILLARVGDTFYAADNRCPHMGGSLSEGKARTPARAIILSLTSPTAM